MHQRSRSKAELDLLDDFFVEEFEASWCPRTPRQLVRLVTDSALGDDIASQVELLRVDLARRYQEDLDVDAYADAFPFLKENDEHAPLFAFEDYRNRRRLGLTLAPQRWDVFAGVSQQSWYKDAADVASKEASKSGRRTSPDRSSVPEKRGL